MPVRLGRGWLAGGVFCPAARRPVQGRCRVSSRCAGAAAPGRLGSWRWRGLAWGTLGRGAGQVQGRCRVSIWCGGRRGVLRDLPAGPGGVWGVRGPARGVQGT